MDVLCDTEYCRDYVKESSGLYGMSLSGPPLADVVYPGEGSCFDVEEVYRDSAPVRRLEPVEQSSTRGDC